MTTTVFVDRTTVIPADWLNDVNAATYLRSQTGAAAPTTGTHLAGELVYNTVPIAGGTVGWVCITAGTPGTWKTFGTIAA